MTRSIPHLLFETAQRHPERRAFKDRTRDPHGDWWDYGRLSQAVREAALGFSTLGVRAGDRVGLLADNSIHWIVCDLAVLALGAADVPRGTDTTPAEIDFVLRHSGARVVVLQDRAALDQLAPVLADIADLRCIVLQRGSFQAGDPRPVLSLDEVRERGRALLENGADLNAHLGRIRGDDTATIVYTSGTTGRPKGVVLTHDNILHNVKVVPSVVEFDTDDLFLSILPAWHMFERLIEYAAISRGSATIYTSRKDFRGDLLRERPTVLAAVPRLYEMLYQEALRRLDDSPSARRLLARLLMSASCAYCAARRVDPATGRATNGWKRLLFPLHRLGDRLVFGRFRAALGGRLRVLVSGGGSLPRHIDEFFDVSGVPLLNGYGLTEAAPLIAVRRRDRPVLGTVGPPIDGTEVEVRDERGHAVPPGSVGILHVRGPQVMRGYYDDRAATRAALDDRGFLDTGDLVRVHPSGDVEITGRAKDTIVLSGGENVEPEPIENALRLSPIIEQVVVVGQDRKQIGALVVPDVAAICQAAGVPALAGARGGGADEAFDPDDEDARRIVRDELVRITSRENGFKPYEQVRRFRLVRDPFTIQAGELTETLKLRRHAIARNRAADIDALFGA